MFCVRCDTLVLNSELSYNISEVCTEIVAVIEEQIGHEIDLEAIICHQCFERSMEALGGSNGNVNTEQVHETVSENSCEEIVCVWCQCSLLQEFYHHLPEGPHRDEILRRISPREIPPDGVVCENCWLRACKAVKNSKAAHNKCVLCRRSLSRRTQAGFHALDTDDIAARAFPQQKLGGGRVCYVCWISAKRNSESASNPKQPDRCVVCLTSLLRKNTHMVPKGLHRKIILKRIYPRKLKDSSMMCQKCWVWAQDAMPQKAPNQESIPQPKPSTPAPATIELFAYKKTTNTSARCFVPGCQNTGRGRVPDHMRMNLLSRYKLYIAGQARVCAHHRTAYNWEEIVGDERFSNEFNGNDIENMLMLLSSKR